MQPNGHDPVRDAGQCAALRRLRRAQRAEARRIRQAVADGYTLIPALLTSPCRVAALAEARQVAMWLMRTRLTWPLPTRDRAFPCDRIGRLLGGRDHATVLHGVAVIAARLASAGRRTPTCVTWSAPSARRSTPPMRPRDGPTSGPRRVERLSGREDAPPPPSSRQTARRTRHHGHQETRTTDDPRPGHGRGR